MKKFTPKSTKPGNITSFTDEWSDFKLAFRAAHLKSTGLKYAVRMFFWAEIRLYFRLNYTPQQAVDKYLGTKYRRAA